MGKITGFLELQRIQEVAEPRERAGPSLPRVHPHAHRRRGGEAGRALHGLRHPVLPDRAARSTTSSRTGTTSCSSTSGATRSRCCTRPTTFPSSPVASAPRPARSRACSTSTTTPSPSSRSSTSSSTRAGKKAGSSPQRAGAQDRQAGRGGRLGSGRARRRRSSSRAPDTTSWSSRAPIASAACCATASPTSRWRSGSSTAAWRRWRAEGVVFRPNANVGVDVPAPTLLRETSTPSC